MRTSPTQRSLQNLRGRGFTVAICERWNPHAMIRQDLFGWIDLIAIQPGAIWGVQTTTTAHMADRRTKIRGEPKARAWMEAGGRIILHGWSKRGPRGKPKTWQLHEEEVTLAAFAVGAG